MANRRRSVEFERWPKYKAAWQRAFMRMWDRWHNRRVKDGKVWFENKGVQSWQDMWEWWMQENQPEAEDECQMGLF